MLKAIDHINIVVSDLQAAEEFFFSLGFEEQMRSKLSGEKLSLVTGLPNIQAEYVALALPAAQTRIELIQYLHPQGNKDTFLSKANQLGLRHIAFIVENIEEEVKKLKEKGVTLESEIQVWEKTGKKLLYFYGPEGIILEYCEYPNNQI